MAFISELFFIFSGANLNPLNQFKTSQGIVIVDSKQDEFASKSQILITDFLEEGEIELPRLKELASDGYYFANSNYMEGLQAFCKGEYFQTLIATKLPIQPTASVCPAGTFIEVLIPPMLHPVY